MLAGWFFRRFLLRFFFKQSGGLGLRLFDVPKWIHRDLVAFLQPLLDDDEYHDFEHLYLDELERFEGSHDAHNRWFHLNMPVYELLTAADPEQGRARAQSLLKLLAPERAEKLLNHGESELERIIRDFSRREVDARFGLEALKLLRQKQYPGLAGLVLALLLENLKEFGPSFALSADQIKDSNLQQLVLLLRMVGDTGPAKRVDDGANEEAKGMLAEAREQATLSGVLLDEGCAADSIKLSTAGLSSASKAFSMARNRSAQSDRVYREVMQRTASFLQTLESRPAEDRGVGEADIAGMHRQIERAEELAINGDYNGAAELLKPVVDRLERRLAAIFDQQTVYYEKNFA